MISQDQNKKVLFIASHRMDRAPGQRFRFEQFMPFLQQNGFDCELSYLMSESDDRLFYRAGNILKKAQILANHYRTRLKDKKRLKEFDLIFISREALMTRSIWFEKAVHRSGIPCIYDFDDAIWLRDVSDANRMFSWMKNPRKIEKTISMADLVFAGNQYLADYAHKFNHHVKIIPTTIDTDEYQFSAKKSGTQLTIGWSGSITTIKHFEYALPFLKIVKKEFGEQIRIRVIGDSQYRNMELDIQGQSWKRASEVEDLSEFDIGIMPLPDDEWARGKCGLKGLQYMALGIPTIMSPVGVNSKIIHHGINGFLAGSAEQWVSIIRQLLTDPIMRKTIGDEARKTIVHEYSFHRWKEVYLQTFQQLTTKD